MAASTCVKCGSTSFDLKETVLRGSPWKFYFVQCSQCGGVVGVLDDQNIGRMLQHRDPALKEIPATQEVAVMLEAERL
jgi:hypothetical protein